jgi:hypothetical protein
VHLKKIISFPNPQQSISWHASQTKEKSRGRGKALVNGVGADEEPLETSEQQITK